MKIVRKSMLLLVCLLTTSVFIYAQDAPTATSIYNEGLELLKAKDYEAGYPKIEEAIKAAEAEGNEKVIAVAKKNGAKAAYNLGSTRRKAKAYDEALELFNRGIELNPEYSSNYVGQAQALDGKGEKMEAMKAYLKAADMLEKAGKTDYANKLYKKASSAVGKIYLKKDYANAIAAGKAHLEVKESAAVHYYLAKSLEKQKDNTQAATHINKAVELAAANGGKVEDKYYWAQGNILEAISDKAGAKAAYQKISGEKYKANATYRLKELEK